MKKDIKISIDSSVVALSIVVVLWMGHCLLNYVWIEKDTWYPFTDSFAYFNKSYSIYKYGGDSIAGFFGAVIKICRFRPPLVFLGPLPFFSLMGVSYNACLVPNFAYLLVLMLSVYGIGSRMFGKPEGLLAAFLVSTYPEIISLSRVYLLDLPMIAATTLCIFALMLTERFRSLPYSLLFGIIFGLAFLVKWTSLVFVVPPALVWFVLPSEGQGWKWPDMRQVRNIIVAGIASFIIVSWWILPNLKPVIDEIINRSVGGESRFYSIGVPFFHPKRLLYYPMVVLSQDVVFFVLFFLGIAAFVWRIYRNGAVRAEHTALLVAWVLVPYAVFTYSPKVWPRFVAPFLPAVCLMASAGFLSLRNKKHRRSLVAAAVALCTLSLVSLTLADWQALGRGGTILSKTQAFFQSGFHLYERLYVGHPSVDYFYIDMRPFREDDWKVRTMLTDVGRKAEHSDKVTVSILSHHPFFHHGAFQYFSRNIDDIQMEIRRYNWASKSIEKEVLGSDYIIIKTGFNGARFAVEEISHFLQQIESNPAILHSGFYEISSYTLPDGSSATLYRSKGAA